MTVRTLHQPLADCPICGSRPRRNTSRKEPGVVCYAGSHRLQIIGKSQPEADRIWNSTAADWATRNSREGQVLSAFRAIEAIASLRHTADNIDTGLDTHAYSLRNAARILQAALVDVANASDSKENGDG